jgi:hypothetical protein
VLAVTIHSHNPNSTEALYVLGVSIRLGELCREFVEADLALRSLSSLLLLALASRPDVGQYIGLISGVRVLNGEVDRFNDTREVLLVGGVAVIPLPLLP